MLINKKGFKLGIMELLLTAVSVLLLAGIHTWFRPCPETENGFMACHWAGAAVGAIAILLLAMSVVHILVPDGKVKIGMDLSMVCIAAMTFFIPGTVISLCMDQTMQCHTHTQPWTMGFSAAVAILAVLDIIVYFVQISKEKHQRV